MLSNALPVVVIRLITIFTDIYTFLHIKLSSKQYSTTYHEENHSLEYTCKNCHTCCNDQSIDKQKIDIPFKSTSFFYVIFGISCSLQNVVLPYSNMIYFWYHLIGFFYLLTLNIQFHWLYVCQEKTILKTWQLQDKGPIHLHGIAPRTSNGRKSAPLNKKIKPNKCQCQKVFNTHNIAWTSQTNKFIIPLLYINAIQICNT